MDKAAFWVTVAAFAAAIGIIPFVIGAAHPDFARPMVEWVDDPAMMWLGAWLLVALLTFLKALRLNYRPAQPALRDLSANAQGDKSSAVVGDNNQTVSGSHNIIGSTVNYGAPASAELASVKLIPRSHSVQKMHAPHASLDVVMPDGIPRRCRGALVSVGPEYDFHLLDIPLAWKVPDDPADPAVKTVSDAARLTVIGGSRNGMGVASARPITGWDVTLTGHLGSEGDHLLAVRVTADGLPSVTQWFGYRWTASGRFEHYPQVEFEAAEPPNETGTSAETSLTINSA